MSNARIQAHLPLFVPVTSSRHRNIHPFMVNFLAATSFSRCHSRSVASQGLIKVLSGKKAYFTLAVPSSIVFPGIASRGSFPDLLTQEMPPERRTVECCMAKITRSVGSIILQSGSHVHGHCEHFFSVESLGERSS